MNQSPPRGKEQAGAPRAASTHLLRIAARLAAEPAVLAAWARDTRHPLLQAGYRALLERTKGRAAHVATALVDETQATRRDIADLVHSETEEATRITFEPSRLKWLLGNRRDRLAVEEIPGYRRHAEDEQEEAGHVQELLDRVLRTVC